MRIFFHVIALIFMSDSYALMPKKLPGGAPRGFVPNLNAPREDLQLISAGTASLITKNWLQNILRDVMAQRRARDLTEGGEFAYDDLHIVSGIQDLQTYLEQSQKTLSNSWGDIVDSGGRKPLIYFAWKPKSLQGFNEVLFLVAVVITQQDEGVFYMDVKNIIQSPFWDEEQIPSIYLKNALLDQNKYTNQTTLRLDRLYEKNLRFKLAWETWFCDAEREVDV